MGLHERVNRIAEAVERAWYHHSAPADDLKIPMSVVALLALIRLEPDQQHIPGQQMPSFTDEAFTHWMQVSWHHFCMARPDVVSVASPLAEWLFADPDPTTITHARQVMVKAIEAGIFEVTMTSDRYEVDLLGHVMQVLRAHGARKHHQVFTPPELAYAMAQLVVEAHGTFYEPAAGTGVMFMAMARTLREKGLDPQACIWKACEIDPLAAALLAVNVVVWDLGIKVLVACDDGLDPEWEQRARTERDGTVDYVQNERLKRGIRALLDLTAQDGGGADE